MAANRVEFRVPHGLVSNKQVNILFDENSTDISTGSLIIAGGVGIGGSLNVGEDISTRSGYGIRFYNLANNAYVGFGFTGTVTQQYTWPLYSPAGAATSVLTSNNSGLLTWVAPGVIGVDSLNGLQGGTQFLAVGTGGSTFNIVSTGSTHTFNIPLAGTAITGLISPNSQTIAGDKTFSGNLAVTGNLTINGTTTTVNSTVTTVVDPVITIGTAIGGTNPSTDDNKDRGLEFKYFSGTAKTGFFGFDDSTGFFTFIPDATNSSEIFSGTAGTLDVNRITGSAASWTNSRTVTFSGGGVTGSFSIDGSANVSGIALTVTDDSIALGTKTTGQYASTIAISGSGITATSASASDGTAYTIYSSAVSTNTASSIVLRDSSGNFSAGTITGTLSGTASTATNSTTTALSGTMYLAGTLISGAASGGTALQVASGLNFVSSTGTLSATTFSGSLSGTATSSQLLATTTDNSSTLYILGTRSNGGFAGTSIYVNTGISALGNTITATTFSGTATSSTNTANTNVTLDTTSTIYLTGSRSNASIGSTPVYVLSGVSALGNTVTATTFIGSLSGTASSSALINIDASTGTRYLLGTVLNTASGSTQVSVGSGITIGNNLLTSGGIAVTNTTVSTSTSTGALTVTGGVGIGGSLWTATTNFSSISGVGHSNSTITSGTWAGNAVSAIYGGTGYTSYTKGDLIVGNGSTFIKLPVGTNNQILTADSNAGSGISWKDISSATYGAFYRTTNQTVAANTATPIIFNATFESNNVSIFGGAGTSSRIKIDTAGTYNIQFSAQMNLSDGNQPTLADFWFRVDGTNVPNSNSRQTVGGKDEQHILSLNFVSTFSAGQYFELVMSSADVNFILEGLNTLTAPTRPDIPSIIITVTPVMESVGGNSLTVAGTNNGDLQYKSGAALGASSSLNFDSATSTFKIAGFPIEAVSSGSANVKLLGDAVSWTGNINGTMLAINTANTYTGDLFNAQIGGTSRFKVSYTGAVSIGNSYTLPITDGTANQVLQTNGSGVVSWANSVISSAQYNIGYYASAGAALTGSSTFTNNTSTGVVSIGHSTSSTGFSTGALVVTGGVGVGGSSHFNNTLHITSSTASTNTTTGALIVTGGVGIGATLNIGADLGISGLTTLTYTSEKLNTKTSATGTVAHDLSTGSVFYHSSISNNFTANFTNVPTTNDRAIGVTLILAQGVTPYMSTALQIDGSAQTIKWVNNSTPTGTASKVDIVGFSLIRTGSAWTVLGQYSTYG
jgi:hypothetical protein